MKKLLFGTCAYACLFALVGVASAQLTSIDAIQYYDPVTGAPQSPFAGQTVTVEGVIYVVKGTYNSGTHYIQGSDGGIAFFNSAAPPLTYGDRVQVTGTVSTFQGEIQISPVTNITYIGNEPEPQPQLLTIGQLMGDYENVGSLIACIGTVRNKASGSFTLYDGADTVFVYIDSDTGINLGAVDNGDQYKVIGPAVNFQTLIELKPRRQSDLIENPLGDTAPIIENVNCVSWVPLSSQAIQVTATITDDNSVSAAQLYYRDSTGDGLGAFSAVAMVNIGGTTYRGTIPAPHPQRQVDFYCSATDDIGQTTTNPGNAPTGFYSVAIGVTPIYDVQYVHPDSASQASPLVGKVVNIRGVVSAGTGQVGAPSRFVMQDRNGGPFSGMFIFEGSGSYEAVLPGDFVHVGGYVNEYFGLTQILPHNGSAVYLVTFGDGLPPAPSYVTTRVLADNFLTDGNGRLGEAWESVWVRTRAAEVLHDRGFGEYLISDTGARADSLIIDPFIELTYQPVIGDVVIIEGFMTQAFGSHRLVPVGDEYIVSGLTAVESPLPDVQAAGGFVAIAPNPFNPRTQIEFALTRPNLVQLNIYNLRGELVRSLVNGRLETGVHPVVWDGTDDLGRRAPSGAYFARLRIGLEELQVRKLSLVQ